MSETDTPVFTPTATEDLVETIKKYKAEALIKFLRNEENLDIDEDDLEIIRYQKIGGVNRQ